MVTFPSIEKITTCYNVDIFNFDLFPLVSLLKKIPQQKLFLPKFEYIYLSSFVNKNTQMISQQNLQNLIFAWYAYVTHRFISPFWFFPGFDGMENDSFHSEQNCIQKVAIFSQKTILLENCEPKICRIYEKNYFTACLLVYQFTTTCSKIRRA